MHGDSSTRIRTGPEACGNTPTLIPQDPEPHHPLKPKFIQFIAFRHTLNRINFITNRSSTSSPQRATYTTAVSLFYLSLFGSFLGTTHSEYDSANFDDVYVKLVRFLASR